MVATKRRRAAAFVPAMIVGLVSTQRAASSVRPVDFLLVFAGGCLFGIGLMGLIQMLRRGGPAPS